MIFGHSRGEEVPYQWRLIIIVAASTIVWLTVTLLTAPVKRERLYEFYRKVRPPARFWRPIVQEMKRTGEDVPPSDIVIGRELQNWLLGVGIVYAVLFGIGNLVLQSQLRGGLLFAVATLLGILIYRNIRAADLSAKGRPEATKS
jgi:hypothetical protein